jgi:hypothetical protein
VTAAPDYVEPVVAWRAWRVFRRGREARLSSLFVPATWSPHRSLTARCIAWRALWRWLGKGHEAPGVDCDCGIYGTTLDVLSEYLRPSTFTAPGARRIVFGRVSLWGSVVECTSGWRAGIAYPERLFVPACAWRSREKAALVASGLEAYGVPVEVLEVEPDEVFRRVAESVRPLVVRPAA